MPEPVVFQRPRERATVRGCAWTFVLPGLLLAGLAATVEAVNGLLDHGVHWTTFTLACGAGLTLAASLWTWKELWRTAGGEIRFGPDAVERVLPFGMVRRTSYSDIASVSFLRTPSEPLERIRVECKSSPAIHLVARDWPLLAIEKVLVDQVRAELTMGVRRALEEGREVGLREPAGWAWGAILGGGVALLGLLLLHHGGKELAQSFLPWATVQGGGLALTRSGVRRLSWWADPEIARDEVTAVVRDERGIRIEGSRGETPPRLSIAGENYIALPEILRAYVPRTARWVGWEGA